MEFHRNTQIDAFPFLLINRDTGDPVTTGTPSVLITQDGGDQFTIANTPIHKGRGQWVAKFNNDEIQGNFIGIAITHPDALVQHFNGLVLATEPTTDYIRGKPITGLTVTIVNSGDGYPVLTGTAEAFIVVDDSDQKPIYYIPTHEGNGQWSINLTGNETNGIYTGLLITHPQGLSQHFTIATSEQEIVQTLVSSFPFYGSLPEAEIYFNNRLDSEDWNEAVNQQRTSALIEATRAIDRLNILGNKTDSTQELQFPRGTDIEVPTDIEYACYEIGIVLLGGYEHEIEAKQLGVVTEAFPNARSAFDPTYVNEYIRAGIPSVKAWDYLKPYLRDSRRVNLGRAN